MRIAKSDHILLVSGKARCLDLLSGSQTSLTEMEAERMAHISKAGDLVRPGDVALLEKGLVVPSALLERAQAELHEEIKADWSDSSTITIMPTEKCDLRCTYCYEEFARGRMPDTLLPGVMQLIADRVADHKNVHLAWFGGEPTLVPDIIEKISVFFRDELAHASRNGSVSITTNARRFNPAMMQLVRADIIDIYQITLDGPKNVHDGRRILRNGGGTYDAIVATIDDILSQSRSRITIRVNLDVSSADNQNEIIDWVMSELAHYKSRYPDRINVNFVPTWDADSQSIDGICLNDLETVERLLTVTDAFRKTQGQTRSGDLTALTSRLGSLSCYAGKQGSYVIGADGTIYKCSVAFGRDDNRIGQIGHDGTYRIDADMEHVWTGQSALTDKNCGGCGFNRSCQGIFCPLMRIQSGKTPCPTEKRFAELYI